MLENRNIFLGRGWVCNCESAQTRNRDWVARHRTQEWSSLLLETSRDPGGLSNSRPFREVRKWMVDRL